MDCLPLGPYKGIASHRHDGRAIAQKLIKRRFVSFDPINLLLVSGRPATITQQATASYPVWIGSPSPEVRLSRRPTATITWRTIASKNRRNCANSRNSTAESSKPSTPSTRMSARLTNAASSASTLLTGVILTTTVTPARWCADSVITPAPPSLTSRLVSLFRESHSRALFYIYANLWSLCRIRRLTNLSASIHEIYLCIIQIRH